MSEINEGIARALTDIATERVRQVEEEGFDSSHDDRNNSKGELASAAAAYAYVAYIRASGCDAAGRLYDEAHPPSTWPWDVEWWKPKSARENLVRAAALILAEIERLDRKAEVANLPF